MDTSEDESVTSGDTAASADGTCPWLRTPLGQALLAREERLLEAALDGLFGEECLQLGLWGEARTFLRYARTQRTACVAPPSEVGDKAPSVFGRLHRLPDRL